MALLGILALLYLGTLLVTEGAGGLVGPSGRRLLSRLRGFPLGLAALLLGAASGSGTGLSLLGRGLLQVGVLPLYEAALLALGGTLGATVLVAVAGLGNRTLAFAALSLALALEVLKRGQGANRLLFGLGLLFLGLDLARGEALGTGAWLGSLPPLALFLAGLLLAFAVGSANLVALLALGLAGEGVGPEGTLALVLGGGVGCTGPVLLRSTPESLRLGLVLLFHRLALALPLLFAPNPGVFPAHAGFHALAFLAFPLAYPLWERLAALLLFLPLHALAPRPFPFWLHLTLVLLLVVFTFPNAQARALEGLGKVAGLAASFTGFLSTLLAALLGTLVGQASGGAPLPFSLGLLGLGVLAFAAVFLAEASPLCGSPPPGGPGGSPPGSAPPGGGGGPGG